MSEWLALLSEEEEITTPLPDTRTKQDKTQPMGENRGLCPVMSGCRVEISKISAAVQSFPKGIPDISDASPHGASVGGRPRTWMGMIVSLDEWRRLGDRESRGSTGKVWNGLTRQWEVKR